MISAAEASRIGRALESVAGWTREIVVVLNDEVEDRTEDIACGHGARVFRERWKGHIAQKNSAVAKASQPWLLGLDVDEAASPELREELHRLFAEPQRLNACAAFSLAWVTSYCGRWIRHGDWGPSRRTRLWRRGCAEWGGVNPHDKLIVRGEVGHLRSGLLHYMAETPDRQVAKIIPYSSEFAAAMRAAERQVSWLDLAVRPTWRFLRAYFLRLGLLDGWQGYHLAWVSAFEAATRYTKVWAAQRASAEPTASTAAAQQPAHAVKAKPIAPV